MLGGIFIEVIEARKCPWNVSYKDSSRFGYFHSVLCIQPPGQSKAGSTATSGNVARLNGSAKIKLRCRALSLISDSAGPSTKHTHSNCVEDLRVVKPRN